MIKVRPADADDVDAILRLARAVHDESPRYSVITFSPEKLRAAVVAAVAGTMVTEPAGGVFVAEDDGNPVGLIAGYVFSPVYSHDKVVTDYTFYVKPDYRGSRAAKLLVKALEAWAVEQEAVEVVPGVSTGVNTEAVAAFYERMGYTRCGYCFVKRMPSWAPE